METLSHHHSSQPDLSHQHQQQETPSPQAQLEDYFVTAKAHVLELYNKCLRQIISILAQLAQKYPSDAARIVGFVPAPQQQEEYEKQQQQGKQKIDDLYGTCDSLAAQWIAIFQNTGGNALVKSLQESIRCIKMIRSQFPEFFASTTEEETHQH